MKTRLFIVGLVTLLVSACTKDVPSLHEQMVGKWRVESYSTEKYDPVTNSSTMFTVPGRPGDQFEFLEYDRILVDFDTAAMQQWQYTQVDRDDLLIQGEPWGITKLSDREFHLSLKFRDSAIKNADPVIYRLARP